MIKTNLNSIINTTNLKRVLAVLMALMLLVLTACSKEETKTDSSNASSLSSQQTSSEPSPEEPDEDVLSSAPSTSDSSNTNSTNSNNNNNESEDVSFSIGDQTVSETEASDSNEVEPIVDPTNLMTNYKGYAEKERNKRLDEILNTPNTAQLYKIKGKTYYVSTSGSDSNDGTTPEKAIQTLAAVGGLPLQDGDAVLFERGCIWRMYEAFSCRPGITYGSYGEGRKPMFLGSAKNFAQEKWEPSKKKNVWQINYMYSYPCGAFFDQGKQAGYLKTSFRSMTANTHFYYDESMATLYLYCDKGNPSKVWDSIEFSQAGIHIKCATNVANVTIDNIATRYTGNYAIQGNYMNENITITNCEIGFAGGAWVSGPSGGLRYGNAIEMWCSRTGHTIDHNWIYHTFDTAISPQGSEGTPYHNISIDDNLLEFNNADFEWFDDYPSTIKNYTMNNNICRFTSLGWGTREDDGGIRGIDGVQRGRVSKGIIQSLQFNNNIIDCPGRMIYKYSIDDKKDYDNWERKGNIYYIKQSLRTTNDLTYQFHWKDASTRVTYHIASTEKDTLAAFAEFEPDAKVYWYK